MPFGVVTATRGILDTFTYIQVTVEVSEFDTSGDEKGDDPLWEVTRQLRPTMASLQFGIST